MDRRTFMAGVGASLLPWWIIRQRNAPIDLGYFRDPAMEGIRWNLTTPWMSDDVTYSTDARVMAWTRDIVLSEFDGPGAGKRPSVDHLLLAAVEQSTDRHLHMVRRRRLSACPACHRAEWVTCPNCRGDDEHAPWCPACGGEGLVHASCDVCDSTGDVEYCYTANGVDYSAAYAELVLRQPDVELFQVPHSDNNGEHLCLAWRSHGDRVHGLLMPMREE